MAYQPNDFVNPYQRGVELPAGCTDLNDALLKMGAENRRPQRVFPTKTGSLKDIPRYVQAVFMEGHGVTLVVVLRAMEAFLYVQNRYGGNKLIFLQRKQDTGLAPILQEFSGNIEVREQSTEGVKLVTIPLPHLWLEAAQLLERVVRAYGVAENAELLFFGTSRGEGNATVEG